MTAVVVPGIGCASSTTSVPLDRSEVSSEVAQAEWDAFVASRPDAVAYHQFAWRGVFEKAFGHETIYLGARRGHALVGVLPLVDFRSALFGRFAVSLPFVNYGGALCADSEAADALESAAVAMARDRQWRHVELRHFEQRFPEWPARRHKVTLWLPLPESADALWQQLDRKVRNQVRKAQKTGCEAEHGGLELVPDFYRVFAHNMRDLGTPVYTRRLFEQVLQTFPEAAQVFVVRVGGEPIAASLTIAFRDRVEVPWASSLRAHSDKSPNMLLYWTMLQSAIARGATTFDFGRSTPDESTFRFKRQWGAEPRPLVWEYLGLRGEIPNQGPGSGRFSLAVRAWQRLPLSVATWLGPSIVRHIP